MSSPLNSGRAAHNSLCGVHHGRRTQRLSIKVWVKIVMSQMTRKQQIELWVVQRMLRICRSFREDSRFEPCLESYERHVSLIMGEPLPPAAVAWIEAIVNSLRQRSTFDARKFLSSIADSDQAA